MGTNENTQKDASGIVIKKTKGCYEVLSKQDKIACNLSGALYKRLIYPTADPSSSRRAVTEVGDLREVDPVAVGDRVNILHLGDGKGLITEILPRRSKLARKAAGRKPIEQVLVANVDQVIPIFAVKQPIPKWNLLDRYLVAAESLNLPSVICLTKCDLGIPGEVEALVTTYTRIGYRMLVTSAETREGMAAFAEVLRDKTSVFIGKSGVGKTSLLNALQPGLGMQVREVSRATGKGKHTTTHLEMFPLEIGGNVVDTPGMREFGLWGVDGIDLAHFFPEMRPLLGACKFGLDCRHDHEPACALKQAVARGEIDDRRYQSYMRMRE